MYKIVGNLWNNIEFLVISNGQKYYVLNENYELVTTGKYNCGL